MKKNLLKTSLMAIMLMVGANAWADNYFTQDYETEGVAVDWTTATSGRFTPVILEENGNHFLSVDQSTRNNNGTTISCTSLEGKVEAGKDFTMSFVMRLSSSTNQTATEFKIYDAANSGVIFSLKETGTWAVTWTVNGTSTQITLPNSNKGGSTNTIADVTWHYYKISRSQGLTYLTILDNETKDVIFERSIIDGSSETGGIGKMQFVTSRYNANFAIDDIVVRDIEDGDVPQATPTTYTIKYVDGNGTPLKDDVTINSIVGIEVQANADQTAPFYANNKKYIYESGNNTITTVEDETANIITLVYREAAAWNYSVTAVDNAENLLQTIATGTSFEEDVLTIGYPLYVLNNGALLTKAATNKEYRTSFTLTSDNYNQALTYTAPANAIENVIFYTEGEDIEGVTKFANGNSEIRSSNAASGYTASDLSITTLGIGKYKITAVACVATGTANFIFKLGNREVFTLAGGANNWLQAEGEFVVAKESTLTFVGGKTNQGLDFLYIQSLGEPTADELNAAVAADQAADEAAAAAIALAAAKADLQAAIDEAKNIDTTDKEGVAELNDAIAAAEAAVAAADATLETIAAAKTALEEAVQAFYLANAPKYGIIWQGEVALAPDSYVTVSTIAIKGIPAKVNDTIRVTVALPLEARAVNKVITKAPEFSVVASLDAEAPLWDKVTEFGEGAQSFDFIVKETQLEALKAVDAFYIVGKELSVTKVELIDGKGTVGIATVENTRQTSNQIYNLRGQKVQNAQKGLYIINGKKVVK